MAGLRDRTPVPDLSPLLRAQRGVITAEQARRCGLTPGVVRGLLRRGEWRRLWHGAYVESSWWPARREDQHLVRCRALLLLLPDGAVLSHVSAAVAHGLAIAWQKSLDEVHVTVPPGVNVPRHPGLRVHRVSRPVPAATVQGLHVTAPARTVVDVGCLGDMGQALVCADSALRCWPRLDLQSQLVGQRGCGTAARAVAFADGRAETALESLARLLWHRAGLPSPALQAVVVLEGTFAGRVDFLWPDARVIVEVDGMGKYADKGEIAREKQRQNKLVMAGYVVLRFTWTDVVGRPEHTADVVRRALRR